MDINTGEYLKTLEGHKRGVRTILTKDNLIISGSLDKTIKIWDINSGECLKTLEGHIGCVRSVFGKDNLIISGSDDKTIRITPISLYPGELPVFQSVVDSFNLAHHLECEIVDYFAGK